jgi:addiction module RelE/StbE family toxin
MEISYKKSFLKLYEKLPTKVQGKVKEALLTFATSPDHIALHSHSLAGKWFGFRSINITGDYRAVYKETGSLAVFYAVGTHAQLYK